MKKKQALRILITAGPTVEDIDPVRFISNRATGTLGVLAARAALQAGHSTVLVHGPVPESVLRRIPRAARLRTIPVRSASQMRRAVMRAAKNADAVIMNAAVADFTPAVTSKDKLKKAACGLTIKLKPTADILKELGRLKARGRRFVLIGFALESGSGRTPAERRAAQLAEARRKLLAKHLDAIVLDTPRAMGADTASFTLIEASGASRSCRNFSKKRFAGELVRLAVKLSSAGLT